MSIEVNQSHSTIQRKSPIICERRSLYVLVRHFVQRFVKNDTLSFDDERSENLVFKLIFLMTGGGFMAHLLLKKYLIGMATGAEGIFLERTFFMTIMMAVTGLFCVISWDNMFLDKKDYANLLTLPVKIRTLLAAKFVSVLVIVGFVSLAFNGFALLAFSLYAADPLAINPFYLGFSHLVSTTVANLFVFFSVSALQGILLVLFRSKLLRKVSIFIQGFLAMGFISVIFWFPGLHADIPTLKAKGSAFVYLFPPLWFTGLSEKILGSNDIIFTDHLYTVIAALVVPLVVYVLTLPLSIKLYIRPTCVGERLTSARQFPENQSSVPLMVPPAGGVVAECKKESFSYTRLKDFFKNLFNSLFLRDLVERAIFYFFISVLRSSKKHKLHLTFVMALPTGYVITQLVYYVLKKGGFYFYNIDPVLISFPFILFFSLVAGLRTMVEIPVMLEANWIFKLSAGQNLKHYRKGLKKAIFFSSIFPMIVILGAFYFYFWEFRPAVTHSLFSFSMSLLLFEVFFLDYKKIPFAGEYNPQASNPKATWPLFFLIFIVYAYTFTMLDLFLITRPQSNGYFYFFLFLIFSLLKRQEYKSRQSGLLFIEHPTPVFLSLDINRD